jgi:hypothetical protein
MFDYAREEVLGWLLRPLDEYFPIVYIDVLFWSTKRDGVVNKEAGTVQSAVSGKQCQFSPKSTRHFIR